MRKYLKGKNIEYNLITSAFTVDFPQPTLDFPTYKRPKVQNGGIHLLNWIVRVILIIKLSRFAELYTFLTPVPRTAVSDLEDHTVLHHAQTLVATQTFREYNIYVTKNNTGKLLRRIHKCTFSIINLHTKYCFFPSMPILIPTPKIIIKCI